MSSKTVKITNGKILNYKISAPNYKTIYGSKLITADSTINHNMIAEDSPNGVYSLGDRIGNIATFVGYFDAQDPNENPQKYAVFVLDAQYRNKKLFEGADASTVGLPAYTTSNVLTDAHESATYNTTTVINNVNLTCFNYTRNFSITLGSGTFQGQMPNFYELRMLINNKSELDSFDPTASSYSTKTLVSIFSNWVYSSNFSSSYNIGSFSGGINEISSGSNNFVIPVFEIPVE